MNTDARNHVKLRTQGKPPSCQVLSQIAYDMWAEEELGHILQDFREGSCWNVINILQGHKSYCRFLTSGPKPKNKKVQN